VPGDRSRKVYGSRAAEAIATSRRRRRPSPWIENVVGRKVVPDGYLERMVKLTNQDNLLRCRALRVISGDILETVPAFASGNQGTRLSISSWTSICTNRRSRLS